MNNKPILSSKGHIVVVTLYKPYFGGTPTVMENLLHGFSPDSFSIATYSTNYTSTHEDENGITLYRFFKKIRFSYRINKIYKNLFINQNSKRLINFCKAQNSVAIIGVYPDIHLFKCAFDAAEHLGIPFIPYLHDTIIEGLNGKEASLIKKATFIHKKMLDICPNILVISAGLKKLYQQKYNKLVHVIEHTYPESKIEGERIKEVISKKSIFWGGTVGRFNDAIVQRASIAAKILGHNFEITGVRSINALKFYGISTENIQLCSYPLREDYLNALRLQGILLLGINWPDESPIQYDELSTIFPTKSIEYLLSGVPILVHCPIDYFLSDFFVQNKCGLVVNDRDIASLVEAIKIFPI